MVTLIHLNGPPGIGKSTLAALWADRHPGTLDLDIDALQSFVGGWRGPDIDSHAILEPVVLAIASTYLAGGRDVIVPQYMASLDRIESFKRVAVDNGAEFCEVVLIAEKPDTIARFEERQDADAWADHVRALVNQRGGAGHLGDMYDQLQEAMRKWPSAIVVTSVFEAVEPTYALLEQALRGDNHEKSV